MTEPLKIAVAGLGTVGAETVRLLAANDEMLARRSGRQMVVTAVSARDRNKERGIDLGNAAWFDDAVALASDADADVVLELIGGEDGIAKAVSEAALANGRDLVTANKALLARHGAALARQAEAAGRSLAYEAAVAGGIPIVKALREGLAANRIDRVAGILNGTCNYILSAMQTSRRDFTEVLAEAQEHGYAEADPSFDVDGVDAAHKLAILASLAFGYEVDFDGVYVEGIRNVSLRDIAYADELGYRIKLVATARRTPDGIEQRVHPCMVPLSAPLAHVDGVFNAVVAEGDFVGSTVYEGQGAGAGPTASAVVADLVDIAAGRRSPTFAIPATELEPMRRASMDRHRGRYYVRLTVRDQPGVIADVAAALRDEQVSMEAMIQREQAPDQHGAVQVVMTTHTTVEASMTRALDRIGSLDTVLETPRMIRIAAM
ncbi:MAG: homoserine dehydrogenase [Alphaproteobacteria bacterium]|nr:homoserine dehydrogenase [Alphaproteobacteria bacterium]